MAKNIFSMNTLAVVVVFLSFVAFSHQQQEGNHTAFLHTMRENNDACVKESGVNQDLPRKAFMDGQFADDPKLKCYFKCMLQKLGRMDANGNVDFSKSMDHIPPTADKAKITAALTKCQASKGTDACDTAFIVAKCFRETVGPLKHEH